VAGISVFMTAGVAAAASGGAPFLGFHTNDSVTVDTSTSEQPTTSASTSIDASTTVTEQPVATPPAATEPPSTELAPTAPPSTELPTTELPTTELPTTEPPTTEPPTTSKPDTVVPQGIGLECTLDHHSVKCHWSGAVVDGFAKVLVLRSDGRVVFMSGDASATSYTDVDVATGSYSYIVVTIDITGKALVHSNRVAVEIAG
jgi:hypothetical protein